MNLNKLLKVLKKDKINFVIQTIIPFFLPFIFEIPDKLISIWIKIPFLIIFSYIDLKLIFLLKEEQEDCNETNYENKTARISYSNAYELNEKKREYLVKLSYDNNFFIPKNSLPYNVWDYIADICYSFKNTISQITEINKEKISVSFIYRYVYNEAKKYDKEWRWVVGKEPTMKIPLNSFVEIKNTVYNFLINGKETVVFCNNKQELEKDNHYFMSVRDKRHNKIGSIFAVKIMFSNNAQSFTEGILIISTYGKQFVNNNNIEKISQLRCLIIDDLFPYYQRLLETELGMLYLKHTK